MERRISAVHLTMDTKIITQYACAVLLILSSIALAFIEVFHTHDITNGILLYIAQACLLAGSIFGLSAYLKKFKNYD